MLDLDSHCPAVVAEVAPTELRYRVTIAASREVVWSQLTVPGRIQPHLGSAVLRDALVVGAPIEYESSDGRARVKGTVLAVDPLREFRHTYAYGSFGDPESEVTWSLEGAGATELRLVHRRLTEGSRTRELSALLWPITLQDLKDFVEHDVARMRPDWPRANPLL